MDNSKPRMNAGYRIINAISVGNKEYVLGIHSEVPNQFVTWECKNGTDYFWGHYLNTPLKAMRDLCERVMDEVQYLEQKEENQYYLTATVKHDGNTAVISFPSQKLGDTLRSIGIMLSPERVYLGGHIDIEVQLQQERGKVADGLIQLLNEQNSLRMVNELAKAVFHADYRVYERVERNLSKNLYSSPEDLLRDAAWYTNQVKNRDKQKREDYRKER